MCGRLASARPAAEDSALRRLAALAGPRARRAARLAAVAVAAVPEPARRRARVLRPAGRDRRAHDHAAARRPPSDRLDLGRRTTLAAARRTLRFDAARPRRSRAARRRCTCAAATPGGELSLAYRPRAGLPRSAHHTTGPRGEPVPRRPAARATWQARRPETGRGAPAGRRPARHLDRGRTRTCSSTADPNGEFVEHELRLAAERPAARARTAAGAPRGRLQSRAGGSDRPLPPLAAVPAASRRSGIAYQNAANAPAAPMLTTQTVVAP